MAAAPDPTRAANLPRRAPACLVCGNSEENAPLTVDTDWTHYFARHGVAYLCYDKRGTGASTGDLNSASIDDLASDVLAAVQAIRGNPAVDARRIGLIGHSNGGWVAPLAASRSSDVAFLVVKSGSALPVAENLLYELEMDMRGAGGFTEDDIANARALRAQMNRALLTNSGWDDLAMAVNAARPERWFGYARVQWLQFVSPPMDSVANAILNGFRRHIDFDPSATWTRVRCPVLVLLGELDANVPAALSADRIRNWLIQGGNRDHAVRLLTRANHGLFEAETGFSREWPTLTRYVPGYLDGIADWLAQRRQKPSVASAMNLTHASTADERDDLVNADSRKWRQRHRGGHDARALAALNYTLS